MTREREKELMDAHLGSLSMETAMEALGRSGPRRRRAKRGLRRAVGALVVAALMFGSAAAGYASAPRWRGGNEREPSQADAVVLLRDLETDEWRKMNAVAFLRGESMAAIGALEAFALTEDSYANAGPVALYNLAGRCLDALRKVAAEGQSPSAARAEEALKRFGDRLEGK